MTDSRYNKISSDLASTIPGPVDLIVTFRFHSILGEKNKGETHHWTLVSKVKIIEDPVFPSQLWT